MPVENLTLAPPQPDSASRPSPLKIGFVSLGCPKNLVDSEVMMGMLQTGGAQITARAEDADVIVVNTCSFIDSAKQESVNTILEMAQHKITGKAQKLIVAGCLVERYRTEIQKNIPEVDAVVGTGELDAILAAAGINAGGPSADDSPFVILNHGSNSQALKSGMPARAEGLAREQSGRFSRADWDGAIADLPNYLYDETTPRVLATPKASAYIKIAEGCDHPCGFCIIPQLRGKFRSRHFESVIAEAERLAASGVREITLIGQDTTCYGEDLGLKDGLALLLERLAQIEDLCWVRFLYAYPNKITGKLLETIARHEKICSYVDVPLQHASNSVLKRMKRGAGAEIFLKSVEKMRRTIPNLTLRTSFIVGFPGETDKVPLREIERRRKKLMQIQRQISKKNKRKHVGRQYDVLALGPSEETDLLWEGRTEMHAPEIDGKLFINDFGDHKELVPGTFYRCEITEAHDYDLVARIVG
jgi:ribosomal protein S12 methylthiotransferase